MANEDQKSAVQKPKHCLTPGFLIPLLITSAGQAGRLGKRGEWINWISQSRLTCLRTPQSPGIFYHVTARLHMSSSGGQWKLCTLQQADAILIMGGGAEEAGDGKLLAVVRCTFTLYLLTCYCTCTRTVLCFAKLYCSPETRSIVMLAKAIS